MSDAAGHFCPGQHASGAFGGAGATIIEHGASLSGGPMTFSTTLAGTFCVPPTGSAAVDVVSDLPGPGTVSVPGTVVVNLL